MAVAVFNAVSLLESRRQRRAADGIRAWRKLRSVLLDPHAGSLRVGVINLFGMVLLMAVAQD